MPGITDGQRARLLRRLRAIADEHQQAGRPDIAAEFLRVAGDVEKKVAKQNPKDEKKT
jgi:hypothetical protein